MKKDFQKLRSLIPKTMTVIATSPAMTVIVNKKSPRFMSTFRGATSLTPIKIRIQYVFLFFIVCCLSTISASALTSVNTSNDNVVPNGLVGYWTFDGNDMTNATATDMSGSGNNGALVGMTASSSKVVGKIGQALKFDGVNDYVEGGRIEPQNFSISLWFRATGAPSTNDSYGGNIIASSPQLFGGVPQYGLNYSWTNQNVSLATQSNAASLFTLNNSILRNKLYHVVAIYDGSTQKIYINGELLASRVWSTNPVYPSSGNRNIQIGRWGYGGYERYFKGLIDDVHIYNRAISSSEVQSLYKAGLGVTQAVSSNGKTGPNSTGLGSGLVGHWTFDGKDITNATATDISGNNNNGTLVNMTASSSKIIGKIGQAIKFNGVNNYIDAGNSSSIKPTFPFSIAGWVKRASSTNVFTIATTGDIGNNGQYAGYQLSVTSSGAVSAQVGDNTGCCSSYLRKTFNTSSGVISANKWYYVVAVFTNINNFSIYVDGLNKTATNDGSSASVMTYSAGGRFRVGVNYDANTSTTYYQSGNVDDLRIYNRALSSREIQSLYKLGQVAADVTPTKTQTGGVGIGSGLVGHWTFDGKHMTNATATDISGNGNNGTLVNMTASSSKTIGKLGQALSFNGVDDYVGYATATDLGLANATSEKTICSWLKTSFTPATAQIIWDNHKTGSRILQLGVNSSGRVQGRIRDDFSVGDTIINGSTVVNNNKWHHACMTITQAKVLQLYVDGATNGSPSTHTMTSGISSVANYIAIGKDMDTSGFNYVTWKGSLDDVRIYNRALSAKEIQTLYKLGAQ